jgi:hypothetical protein
MQKLDTNTSSQENYTEDEQQKIVYLKMLDWGEIYIRDVHYWVAPTALRNTWHTLSKAYAYQKFMEGVDTGDY